MRSGRNDDGERLDAAVFAVGAVGVRVEIAEGGAFGDGPNALGNVEIGRRGNGQRADATWLGKTNCNSGGLAQVVWRGFGGLPESYDEQARGHKFFWRVKKQGFIRFGLEFTG